MSAWTADREGSAHACGGAGRRRSGPGLQDRTSRLSGAALPRESLTRLGGGSPAPADYRPVAAASAAVMTAASAGLPFSLSKGP